jgi:hypothetical protein
MWKKLFVKCFVDSYPFHFLRKTLLLNFTFVFLSEKCILSSLICILLESPLVFLMLFISRIFSLFSLPKVSIPGNQLLYINDVTAGLQVRILWILDPDSENQMMTSFCVLTLALIVV